MFMAGIPTRVGAAWTGAAVRSLHTACSNPGLPPIAGRNRPFASLDSKTLEQPLLHASAFFR